jgi:5-methylthioadenosine/S-adenosylhomocysteine deaminase
MLGPNLLIVHAVDVTRQDMGMIKRKGASVAHCPRSNRSLHVGVMPLKAMLDAGIPVGLGTDSLASVKTLNLWDEMRLAYKIHRKSGISPKSILSMATMGGARALGMGKQIGSLEPGKFADIIAVPLPRKNTGDIYSDLLRETEYSIITMVQGKIIHQSDAL